MKHLACFAIILGAATGVACGDDDNDGMSLAQRLGIGSACATMEDCPQDPDNMFVTQCLTTFTDGYCGLQNCTGDQGCPPGSRCVTHDDGVNYCFLECGTKSQCNQNRPGAALSNCSSNIDRVSGGTWKACVPSSSG